MADVDWIHPAHNKDQWTLVKTAVNRSVTVHGGHVLSS
jgi:hypothetical protein